ncbi:MAG: hypothetical protein EPN50_06090, partial [Chloroflexota bacterium]
TRPPATAGAKSFGARLRAARLAAGLTQTGLAGERYTKAFVSALEHDESRPSVPALEFFAGRLGLDPADLLGTAEAHWSRLEADLHLTAGDWSAAADAYERLLEGEVALLRRAELLGGRAEALSRLGRHRESVTLAAEAAALFAERGRAADAAHARYWQASGLYWLENHDEARALLRGILDAVRAGLAVEPGFELRVLIALAMVEGRDGHPERALTYLDEARGRVGELDDRRRGSFLQSLAISYREAGDHEGALVLGRQAVAAFTVAASQVDLAVLDNELALTHLARGDLSAAHRHAEAAHERFTRLGEASLLANVAETRASIALARGALDEAEALAADAARRAQATDNVKALVSATLTRGRIAHRRGELGAAVTFVEEALAGAREHGRSAQVRECLVELSDLAAAGGDTARAYALAREALG